MPLPENIILGLISLYYIKTSKQHLSFNLKVGVLFLCFGIQHGTRLMPYIYTSGIRHGIKSGKENQGTPQSHLIFRKRHNKERKQKKRRKI